MDKESVMPDQNQMQTPEANAFEAGEESMLSTVMPHLEELSAIRKAAKAVLAGQANYITINGSQFSVSMAGAA